jgi:hypothetical protein
MNRGGRAQPAGGLGNRFTPRQVGLPQSLAAEAECRYLWAMQQPRGRTLAGIALILLLIVFWAAFVASLAPVVSRWPILVQAPFYLIMGIIWIIPLKPLVRWIQTGRWKAPADDN